MQIHTTVDSIRKAVDSSRVSGARIGFVPTMGALHDGHASLATAASNDGCEVVMSIFVNPLQFEAFEDLDRYPRPFDRDVEIAESLGVAHVFAPSVEEMYPNGKLQTSVAVAGVSQSLEGELRPGHFSGVATVVTKLFSIVGSCKAYFGEKDWQQLEVVRKLVDDLSLPVEVVGCPIVREDDGLALSSRNVFLDADQRAAALGLSKALQVGLSRYRSGLVGSHEIREAMLGELQSNPLVQTQYVAHVGSAMSTKPVVGPGDRLLVAAEVGPVHLIDNVGVPE